MKHFKFELRGRRRIHKSPTQREAAERGHWLARADGREVLVTLHPSALLRLRDGREAAFADYVRDLERARKVFG